MLSCSTNQLLTHNNIVFHFLLLIQVYSIDGTLNSHYGEIITRIQTFYSIEFQFYFLRLKSLFPVLSFIQN